MLRLVRHPIHIFTASPSGSFQHALWALSPLKCCSWHQPAKLTCKLAATPKREKNSFSDQNSPQPFHLHTRQRVLHRKCLTDNNVAEQWLKTFKTDYNFSSWVLSLLQRFQMGARFNWKWWHGALKLWDGPREFNEGKPQGLTCIMNIICCLFLYQAHSSQLWKRIRCKNTTSFPDNKSSDVDRFSM